MPNVPPIPREELAEYEAGFQMAENGLGFLPNSMLTMAHRPQLLHGFRELAGAALFNDTLEPGLPQLIANVTSTAAGCRYCQAHTATIAAHQGADDAKIEAIWEFETSEHFTDAERAALRLARDAGQVPNATTPAHFEELRKYYSEQQIVGIVAVIALFGFLNRWNDTMATALEEKPSSYAHAHLDRAGWDPGKHVSTP